MSEQCLRSDHRWDSMKTMNLLFPAILGAEGGAADSAHISLSAGSGNELGRMTRKSYDLRYAGAFVTQGS